MSRWRWWRAARWSGVAALVLALLLFGSFAVPIDVWRTGELAAPPLPVVANGPTVEMAARVWVDTDAACGAGRTTDPDDCLALLALARTPGVEIVGVSTVFGNASLATTDEIARELAARLGDRGAAPPPVYRGAAKPAGATAADPPAWQALRQALQTGPLTVVALGPLTNVAAALAGRPRLQARVSRLVAVMGRRPGHLFHPAEGEADDGMLFGHGPVFRDFNLAKDTAAARAVFDMRLPTTLLPYDAARDVELTADDLDRLVAEGGPAAWVAGRARSWLGYWRDDVGRDGFYPFDLLAAVYVDDPALFHCAVAAAWIDRDRRLWNLWFHDPPALLVGRSEDVPAEAGPATKVAYCTGVDAGMHEHLMRRLRDG